MGFPAQVVLATLWPGLAIAQPTPGPEPIPVFGNTLSWAYQNYAYHEKYVELELTADGRVGLSFALTGSVRPIGALAVDLSYQYGLVLINRADSPEAIPRANHSGFLNIYYVWDILPQQLEWSLGAGGFLSGYTSNQISRAAPRARVEDILSLNHIQFGGGPRTHLGFRPVRDFPLTFYLELGYAPWVVHSSFSLPPPPLLTGWDGAFSARFNWQNFFLMPRYFARFQQAGHYSSVHHGLQLNLGYSF